MKKLLLFSLVALLLNACSSSDEKPLEDWITIEPQIIENVSKDGGTFTIEIKSSVDWVASVQANWCTLSAKEGSKNESIVLTVAKNESNDTRQTKLGVGSVYITETIQILQQANDIYTTGKEAIVGGLWVLDATYTPSYDIDTSSEDVKSAIIEKLSKIEPYSNKYAFYVDGNIADGDCDADGVSRDGYYSVMRENELNISLKGKPINSLAVFTKSVDNDNVLYIHERLRSEISNKWPQIIKANKIYRYTRK